RLTTEDISLPTRQLPQQLHHLHVPGIRGGVVGGDLEVGLRGLEDEGHALAAGIGEEPAEGLTADLAAADQRVPVTVAAQLAFAVVEMEEAGRFPGRILEGVEDSPQLLRRTGEIVAGRVEMAGVEAVAGARPQPRRDVLEDHGYLVRGSRSEEHTSELQ